MLVLFWYLFYLNVFLKWLLCCFVLCYLCLIVLCFLLFLMCCRLCSWYSLLDYVCLLVEVLLCLCVCCFLISGVWIGVVGLFACEIDVYCLWFVCGLVVLVGSCIYFVCECFVVGICWFVLNCLLVVGLFVFAVSSVWLSWNTCCVWYYCDLVW